MLSVRLRRRLLRAAGERSVRSSVQRVWFPPGRHVKMLRCPLPYVATAVSAPAAPIRRRSACSPPPSSSSASTDAGPLTMTAICAGRASPSATSTSRSRTATPSWSSSSTAIAVEVMDASLAALERGGSAEERARSSIAAMVAILTEDPRKGRAALVASLAVPVLRDRRQELLGGFAAAGHRPHPGAVRRACLVGPPTTGSSRCSSSVAWPSCSRPG